MKKQFLLILLLLSVFSHAQPKIVGQLSWNGKKSGGSIFRSDLPGTAPDTIHFFDNLAPHLPKTGVIEGDGNWLYGMLQFNGNNNNGCLYKIQKDGTGFSVVYRFENSGGTSPVPFFHSDGHIYFSDVTALKKYNPATGIVTDVPNAGIYFERRFWIDADDWIYMRTGPNNLTRIKTDGSLSEELHTFDPPTEGTTSIAGVTEIPGDSIFGVNVFGGTNDKGTIYSLKKDGSEFTVHHHFEDATGIYPESKLVYFDGKLYGTCVQGGDFGNGVAFTIYPDGTGYRVLHHFENAIGGGSVYGNISISSNGRIFGAFYQFHGVGFTYNRLFKVDTSGQDFTPFYIVDQRQHGHFNQDPLLVNDETIFLATSEMGRHDGGVLSEADTSGIASSLHHFGFATNGFRPRALIKGSDTKLYGTTSYGGLAGNGIIYSINDNGTGFIKLHEFTDAEGYETSGKLLEASDGKLYGAYKWGGPINGGGIYRINKNGTGFEVIFSSTNLNDGYTPVGSLTEDAAGILYGANIYGPTGWGSVFKLNKDGTGFSLIKTFTSGGLTLPFNGVVVANDYLYGTCGTGGAENRGGIFRMKKDGSGYQVLHEFGANPDGGQPEASPLIASNGKLYGTTVFGGSNGHGIIYRLDTTGTNYTILKHFNGPIDGGFPQAPIIQASDGLLYGSCQFSNILGSSGGILFKINLDGSGFAIVRSFELEIQGQGNISLLDLQPGVGLPVQLLDFTAERLAGTALLKWATSSEQNSDRFEIERAEDGRSFVRIGVVAAAGNTNSKTYYNFTDHQPLKGINSYRLKQLDTDGSFTYSKTVTLKFNDNSLAVIGPNPVSDKLNIWFQKTDFSSLSIFDATGKLVLQREIPASSANIQVAVHHLSRGWYLLKLNGKQSEKFSFIKE